jgi:hypothetical protein
LIGGGVGWQAFDDFGEVVLGIEILRAAVGEQGVAERLADVVGWALFFYSPRMKRWSSSALSRLRPRRRKRWDWR